MNTRRSLLWLAAVLAFAALIVWWPSRTAESCAESLVRVQIRSALEWGKLSGDFSGDPSQLGGAPGSHNPPDREPWERMLADSPAHSRVFDGLRSCPSWGRMSVKVGPGSLNVPVTYVARCSIHGNLADIRNSIGDERYRGMLESLRRHLALDKRALEEGVYIREFVQRETGI